MLKLDIWDRKCLINKYSLLTIFSIWYDSFNFKIMKNNCHDAYLSYECVQTIQSFFCDAAASKVTAVSCARTIATVLLLAQERQQS